MIRLTTPRLTLRPHRLDDFDDSFALWSDADVARFIGGRPSTHEEVWSRMLRYAGHWDLLGYGYFIVHERDSGRFIGEAGLADFHRELEPGFGDTPECGWAFVPSAHGKGFATESVAAILAWRDQALKGDRTVCLVAPDNAASIRVAEKTGFGAYAETSYKGNPTVLMERLST